MSDSEVPNCGNGGGADDFFGLRVASIFVILVGSLAGAFFPVLAKRSSWLHVPNSVYDIFIVELIAFRWGTARLKRIGVTHDAHGHGIGSHAAHGPESAPNTGAAVEEKPNNGSDVESQESHRNGITDSALAQIIGVAILEFGGLGVGSRLAYMRLPPKYAGWVPHVGAFIYGITTPIGIAAGLGVRTTYNPGSTTASIVSGTLDSLSSGILIYTGLVELLAHEFLFNREMMESSNGHLAYALICMLLGCGIMALIGRWA
ncbi:hypothetical protein H0H87_009841 [Tephrocybe sp. NHM501043]|nr:hypothetical protein H0H87_009841 [Tephrocybe sp. NHM501043]